MPRMCTAMHISDPRKEENNHYLADAEVDVEFVTGCDEGLKQSGVVFDFEPLGHWVPSVPAQPEHWVGHFDFEGKDTL